MLQTNEPGAPVEEGIPLCVPEIGPSAWIYLQECLRTNYVSSVGPFVDRFEREVARAAGCERAIATASGTAALHIALLLAGVTADDEVLVPTLTFIAPANAVRYLGAWPVFVDVDPLTWQLDVSRLADFLELECRRTEIGLVNVSTGRRVRAVLPVHVLGHPVDLDPTYALAEAYGLAVVEDATESLGARYRGRPVGQGPWLSCFSFNGNKLVTTGGGGAITTSRSSWADRARYLTTQAKIDPVEYIHGEVGYNYRLTNLQAALGCAQMEALDDLVAAKRSIAAHYADGLDGLPGISLMPTAAWAEPTYWLYTVLVDETVAGVDSRSLLRTLAAHGIQSRPLWQPLHQSPAHRGARVMGGHVAERLHRQALSLPSSAGLLRADQTQVIDVIRRTIGSHA